MRTQAFVPWWPLSFIAFELAATTGVDHRLISLPEGRNMPKTEEHISPTNIMRATGIGHQQEGRDVGGYV